MGAKTRAALMQQAGLAAGNDQAATYVRVWLDDWLSRTAKSWSWPLLKKRVQNLAIGTGSGSVGVGSGYSCTINGQTLTTHHVHKLLGGYVLWKDASSFNPRGRAVVRPLHDGNPDNDEDNSDPTTRKGAPATCKVRQSADGALTLYLDPTPDRALVLNFDVLWIPPSIGSSSAFDSQIPWYPNDRTLHQAVKCAILELDAGAEASQVFEGEMMKLAAMVVDDRDFDGTQAGDNEVMGLDPASFPPQFSGSGRRR